MSALSGPERKQAMGAIEKALQDFLKTKAADYEDSFYHPDLTLIKGTKDWTLAGVGKQAVVETPSGDKKFTLSGKFVATGSDYGSYKLDNAVFAWA